MKNSKYTVKWAIPPETNATGHAPGQAFVTRSTMQERVAISIGWILQGGVLLSATLILLGFALLPTRPGGLMPQRVLNFPETLAQVWQGLLILRPQAIITLGLFVLIATPVVRVAASIIAFMLEHDRTYVIITSVVLAILLFSIFYLGMTVHDQSRNNQLLSFSLVIVLLIFLGSIVAGLLGSLVGLGGGVLIVPLLTLVFKLPISFAIGVSIISVIATSSGASAAYVRDHLTNMWVCFLNSRPRWAQSAAHLSRDCSHQGCLVSFLVLSCSFQPRLPCFDWEKNYRKG